MKNTSPSQKKLATFTSLLIFGLILAGCNNAADDTRNLDVNYTTEDNSSVDQDERAEFEDENEGDVNELEQKTNALMTRVRAMTGTTSQEFKDAMSNLEQKMDDAKAAWNRLSTATADNWEELKDEVEAKIEDWKEAYDDAEEEIEDAEDDNTADTSLTL